MNITDFTSVMDNVIQFSTREITSKIKNGQIVDIKIHNFSNKPMLDKDLQQKLNTMYNDYKAKWGQIYKNLAGLLNKDFAKHIISKYYVLLKGLSKSAYDIKDLCYMVEIKIVGKNKTRIGDKLANRYANKGIVSLIIPDELRPYALNSKKPIDYISGPLSVISRMNFGYISHL